MANQKAAASQKEIVALKRELEGLKEAHEQEADEAMRHLNDLVRTLLESVSVFI
jgi:hypothetical protein